MIYFSAIGHFCPKSTGNFDLQSGETGHIVLRFTQEIQACLQISRKNYVVLMAILGSDIPEGKLGGTGHIGVRSTSSESGLITLRYTPASIHISPAILSGVSGHIGFRYTRRKIWCIWMYWCELYQLSWTFPISVVTWWS